MRTTKTASRIALIAGVSLMAMAGAAHAQTARSPEESEARIAALEAQLQALAGQIAELKTATTANTASLKEARPAAPANAVNVTLANARPTFSTADGAFSASVRGILQMDAAIHDQRAAGPLATDLRRGSFNDAAENDRARDLSDGTNVRRARFGIEGKAFGAFDYNMIYDFGGSGVEEAGKISAAWIQYSGYPVKVRIGYYPAVTSLEDASPYANALFTERASVAETVRGLSGGDGRAGLGLMANGERWNAAAHLTGAVVTSQSFDEQVGFIGRVAYVPFKGKDWLVHVGANANLVLDPAATGPDIAVAGGAATPVRLRDRPELRVDSVRLIDTGNIDADGVNAFGLELAAQRKNVYVQAEYFDIDVERRNTTLSDPGFDGWYVQAGWTLTGEPRRYSTTTAGFDAPRAAKPFNPKKNQWGAVELGLRFSTFDLNHMAGGPGNPALPGAIRGGQQNIVSVGLNWYLNNVVTVSGAYRNVEVRRLSPGGTAFGAGATPAAGAQVGQDLDIWSLRTQYSF